MLGNQLSLSQLNDLKFLFDENLVDLDFVLSRLFYDILCLDKFFSDFIFINSLINFNGFQYYCEYDDVLVDEVKIFRNKCLMN